MSRRPSLADTMKAVAAKAAPPPVPMREAVPKQVAQAKAQQEGEGERKPFFAATREGLKRITVAVAPADHKRLKRLSVDTGRSIEDLMREALADLFAKHD
ncbi:ribbon-helix-helix domain-containing protein [Methylocystis iwaonis]|uniref:Antitoxin-like ribbon-helix-helix domain-containing protein n=1 Tax=Methylocystis iwaonis TaxID=2885079 RepID=A0ABM8EFP2_9HYPH|nr:ribbon-helix-helix domain-containing protein [Methylocystis iwaonis]BDV36743.1 hypothetical protein SS37A_42730 [Methylocystis iwaonis]